MATSPYNYRKKHPTWAQRVRAEKRQLAFLIIVPVLVVIALAYGLFYR